MKFGLLQLPNILNLSHAYDQILRWETEVNETLPDYTAFALYCQWSRFDSRLGEICTGFISRNWRKIHPLKIREAFLGQPWPTVLGVLLEFSGLLTKSNESPEDFKLYQMWKNTAIFGIPKANWEQYFIGKRRIAGRSMLDDARFSIQEYRKWGYLAREVLINKQRIGASGNKTFSYSSETRLQILKELVETLPRFNTETYWNAVGRNISRRQAERDLMNSPLIRSVGRTQGRFYLSNYLTKKSRS
ncbi:MAG: hypothetical protein ABI041_13545 [Bdellovibrionia bacterium]